LAFLHRYKSGSTELPQASADVLHNVTRTQAVFRLEYTFCQRLLPTCYPARMTQETTTQRKLAAIPGGVWALGFVSMLMDISSEMIHALLPLYLVVALSTSALTVGIMEGIAEAIALVAKIFSGALSDPLEKRKFLAVLGFGLAGFTKPIFPLASTVEWLMVARFVIQSSPHDVGGWSVVPTIPAMPSVNRHYGAQCQLLSWAHAT